MYLPITFILYGLCQCSPSYPSLQHVIGHKKLQLCINLLHWSLKVGGMGKKKEQQQVSNGIESNWVKGEAKREGGRMANGWRGHGASTWSAYHYMPSNFNVEPFGQDRQDSQDPLASPRVAPPRHNTQHLISVVNDANIIICSCDFSESGNL